MVRRSAPYSFKAAASAFCRPDAESLPTSGEAVACPTFSDPATRSRSSRCSARRSVLSLRVSSGPVYVAVDQRPRVDHYPEQV
jgi:hypothetical protein